MAAGRLVVDQGAFARFTLDRNSPLALGVEKIAVRVVNEAKRRCPVDEGRLRSSITYEIVSGGRTVSVRVGSNVEYAYYVHEGRGPVFPVNAKVLRWRPKGSSTFIFRPSAGPADGQPFLRDALRAVVQAL